MEKAVLIFSGGQDSTTCLGWAHKQGFEIHPITFFYGQRHEVEIQAAYKIINQFDRELETYPSMSSRWRKIDISFLPDLVTSELTKTGSDISAKHPDNDSLPASFVPNRNAIFITLAHAYAQKIHSGTLIGGMCETDFSGYPDCREVFIQDLVDTLNIGSSTNIEMLTPLMFLTKAETFKLAEDCGVLDLVLKYSRTCYNGSDKKNEWGFGCGECPACKLREKGWKEFSGQ